MSSAPTTAAPLGASAPPPAAQPRTRLALSRFDLGLYAAVVFAWSTSWIAIRYQLGVVSPEVSVMWRFALASAIMFVWARASGARLAYPAAMHVRFAGLGLLLFGCNFLSFYYGGLSTPSGLLAVVFSTASLFNMLLAWPILGQRIEPRVAAGAALGLGGVFLMFAPRLLSADFGASAQIGFGLCILGTLFFCSGNMLSSWVQRQGVAVIPASAWGMLYGSAALGLFAWIKGDAFVIEWTLPYLGGLVWLAVVASVVAFAAYLTLLGRIGAARAGYSTVMFPVFALAISTVFEGYVWTLPAAMGLVLVLAGNVLVLRR
ncbi:membrane protein [Alsobacter metallidurans]|uniref:Membrane protein n=1 Tax=Alsobacter metallidurans TaxID=340221 RepID=A0A917I7P1_9HYPH|nr:DMT family transporter [Alsobacter metallidurans]GGH19635.1 membrane protein [Alsobacter metallidurans]